MSDLDEMLSVGANRDSSGGTLHIVGRDLAGITMPATFYGSLDLLRCNLKGVTFPVTLCGSLHIIDCDDLTGVTLPVSISGVLGIAGCDLTGVTMPTSISGVPDIAACDLTGFTTWWRDGDNPIRRRCIAISYYALIETEDGHYIAGCRGPWSAKTALNHWGDPKRTDVRARKFVEAIMKAEAERNAK